MRINKPVSYWQLCERADSIISQVERFLKFHKVCYWKCLRPHIYQTKKKKLDLGLRKYSCISLSFLLQHSEHSKCYNFVELVIRPVRSFSILLTTMWKNRINFFTGWQIWNIYSVISLSLSIRVIPVTVNSRIYPPPRFGFQICQSEISLPLLILFSYVVTNRLQSFDTLEQLSEILNF